MKIRKGNLCDAESIFSIRQEVEEKSSVETIKSELTDDNYLVYVLEEEGQAVSFLTILKAVDDADVIMVATKKDFQGRGFAKMLFLRAIDDLKNSGIKRLLLEVRDNNEKAIGLYSSLGFKQIGIRKGYYEGRIDARVLELTINYAM